MNTHPLIGLRVTWPAYESIGAHPGWPTGSGIVESCDAHGQCITRLDDGTGFHIAASRVTVLDMPAYTARLSAPWLPADTTAILEIAGSVTGMYVGVNNRGGVWTAHSGVSVDAPTARLAALLLLARVTK